MKYPILAIFFFITFQYSAYGQNFDCFGPAPFGDILHQSFSKSWTPAPISNIQHGSYIVLMDQATKSKALMIDDLSFTEIQVNSVDSVNGSEASYSSLLRSVFQIEDDKNSENNNIVALSGQYQLKPLMHSYYALNSSSASSGKGITSNAGNRYVDSVATNGYVLIELNGSADSSKIKGVSRWSYNSGLGEFEELTWVDQYLQISGDSAIWVPNMIDGTDFYLANANDLVDLESADGSDFNPTSIPYQPNASAEIPFDDPIEEAKIFTALEMDVNAHYKLQFRSASLPDSAASLALDTIECLLASSGDSLRYPKKFYLALRENMLSHEMASSDIYNGALGFKTIPEIYFTYGSDTNGDLHPFMVIASHVVSARPNLLADVNRPPGAQMGVSYGESTVTRNGKVGSFLIKIPLKDYGQISSLLENDLSPFGDLASDFDANQGTVTVKDVFNYTGLASIGVAVDGVTLYPSYNNNLKFTPIDAEITNSGIHVGGGLELHYHADGHAFNGNGINLYNIADYISHDHPPAIGISYDGIALFGRYESAHSTMAGFGVALDEYGGHDHDDFGYHYHAHTIDNVSDGSGGVFDMHVLLVGAWKGRINDIPGFLELKDNQLKDTELMQFAGGSYSSVSCEISNCPTTLRTWTGATDSEWLNASNWSPMCVPTALDSVVVPSGVSNTPVISNSTTAFAKTMTVHSLTEIDVEPGGVLNVIVNP